MNNVFNVVWFVMRYPGRECDGMDVSLLPIKISSSPPEPRHQNQKLRWDHQVCTVILSESHNYINANTVSVSLVGPTPWGSIRLIPKVRCIIPHSQTKRSMYYSPLPNKTFDVIIIRIDFKHSITRLPSKQKPKRHVHTGYSVAHRDANIYSTVQN